MHTADKLQLHVFAEYESREFHHSLNITLKYLGTFCQILNQSILPHIAKFEFMKHFHFPPLTQTSSNI